MQTNMAITEMAQIVQVILDRSQELQAAASGFARTAASRQTRPVNNVPNRAIKAEPPAMVAGHEIRATRGG
jgi:hypothetical protein